MDEYIDRNLLLEKLQERDLCLCVSESDIKELPAADVAPVVHGRWESHLMPLAYKCSTCGYKPSAKEWRYHKRNFCPNCGAKMDKEER